MVSACSSSIQVSHIPASKRKSPDDFLFFVNANLAVIEESALAVLYDLCSKKKDAEVKPLKSRAVKKPKTWLHHDPCMKCRTVTTPLWREGPAGKGTLCNACGIRLKRGSQGNKRKLI